MQNTSPIHSDIAAWLEKVAMCYLARFEAPRVRVRRLLLARLKRAAFSTDQTAVIDWTAGHTAVEIVLARLVALRLIDDDRFARLLAQNLNRKGRSLRVIQATLQNRGVALNTAVSALTTLTGEAINELRAAAVYCCRRHLGPFRPLAQRQALRLRDLAALGRAGFEIATACQVIDAATAEDVETWAVDPTLG